MSPPPVRPLALSPGQGVLPPSSLAEEPSPSEGQPPATQMNREAGPPRDSRRFPRVDLRLWAEGLADGRLQFLTCSNLSAGGMFVEATTPYPVGKVLHLEFNLPGVPSMIKVTGRVVSSMTPLERGVPLAGNGIAFLDLSPAAHAMIRQFIASS